MIIGLQETLKIVEPNIKDIQKKMDDTASFHPADASIYNGLKPDDYLNVKETIKAVSLEKLITEYLGSGSQGSGYLIPDKIYDILFTSAATTDIAPMASQIVSCPGSSLKIDVEVDGQFVAKYLSGGGLFPDESIQTTQVTATPKLFGIKTAITNELIEDSQFNLIETHLSRAAKQMGEFSTRNFLADLITCTDGDGTQQVWTTTTANRTYIADLYEGWQQIAQNGAISDTVICSPEVITDLKADGTVSAYANDYHTRAVSDPLLLQGSVGGMNLICITDMNEAYAGTGALYLGSKWHSFVLAKEDAMLTVRKRWLKTEHYSDPVRDLVGMVITARQDQVSIYNDHSCEVTEV